MPSVTTKQLPKSRVELAVEVSSDEVKPFLDAAAKGLSSEKKIPGFRPGTAPIELVRRTFGDDAVIGRAAEKMVQKTYVDIVQDTPSLEAIGKPEIKLEHASIGDSWKYVATVAVLPKVTLGTYREVSGTRKEQKVEEKEIEAEIQKLRVMRASYLAVSRPAQAGDQIRADVSVRKGNVPLEDGAAKDQRIQLGEKQLLPEFEQALLGSSPGETKTFDVTFPENHHDQKLRGETVTFVVMVKDVQQRILPDTTDEFAKGLGKFSGMEDLRSKLQENMLKEKSERERERIRQSLIQQLVKGASFSDIPDVMIDREVDTMMHELEHGVASMGLTFEQYLKQIGKTRDQVKEGMRSSADTRVKAALVLRAVADVEKIQPSDEDVQKEMERLLQGFPNPKEAEKRIDPGQLEHMAIGTVRNRLVIERLEKFAGIS
jgi:trigger factor